MQIAVGEIEKSSRVRNSPSFRRSSLSSWSKACVIVVDCRRCQQMLQWSASSKSKLSKSEQARTAVVEAVEGRHRRSRRSSRRFHCRRNRSHQNSSLLSRLSLMSRPSCLGRRCWHLVLVVNGRRRRCRHGVEAIVDVIV